MLINAITIEAHTVGTTQISILLFTALICDVIEYECTILKHVYFCIFYVCSSFVHQMFMFSFIDQITCTECM